MRSTGVVGGCAVVVAALLIIAGLSVPRSLPAQVPASGFPGGKPITLIVPYAAGGTTDSGARLLAARLDEELSTRVQVVNRAGAASQVGLQALLASPPNGYTLSYAVLPTVITHSDPEREPPYARKDFRPVAHHHLIPAMIAVSASSPHKTLKEFVEAARANPGKITISDSALMGNPHLSVLMLQKAAGVRFASVHFDGGAYLNPDDYGAFWASYEARVAPLVKELRASP